MQFLSSKSLGTGVRKKHIFCALSGDNESISIAPEEIQSTLYALSFARGNMLPENLSTAEKDNIKKLAIGTQFVGMIGNGEVITSLQQEGYLPLKEDGALAAEAPYRSLAYMLVYKGHLKAISLIMPYLGYTKNLLRDEALRFSNFSIIKLLYEKSKGPDEDLNNDYLKNMLNTLYNISWYLKSKSDSLVSATVVGDVEEVKNVLVTLEKMSHLNLKIRFRYQISKLALTQKALEIAKSQGNLEIVNILEEYRKPVIISFQRMRAIFSAALTGILAAITLSWTFAVTAAATVFSTLGARLFLKQRAYEEYQALTVEGIGALTTELQGAFDQGVKSGKSYWELLKSNNPLICPAACLHWKAYFAGQQAGELQDEKLIEAVLGTTRYR